MFATDPWDAEYLGVSKKELSQSLYLLRARGLVEIDASQTYARPSDKLLTSGWPEAGGSSLVIVPQKVFELSRLPKKEDLTADLGASLKQGLNLALVFIDLDRFKEVNDSYGHARGDVCLEETVKAVGSVLGRKGRFYRWGGDEFAIMLRDFSTKEALVTAERIRRAIEGSKAGGGIELTASVGVCATDRIGNATSETLLKAADDAMYASKRDGKNRVTTPTRETANHPGKLSCEKTNSPLRFSAWLGINNEPRAIVWLAGRISATLVRVRHLMSLEGSNPSIVPATGRDSEASVGLRRVPSRQGPPKVRSFLNFLSSAFAPA